MNALAPVVFDHAFICTGVGAPGAGKLVDFGLREGTPNQHPGQGTANRRFFFRNAMLELLWVDNAEEARSKQTRNLRLWERWSEAGRGASPFGIVLRPSSRSQSQVPFPSWQYRPELMPDLVLKVASGVELAEPIWFYMAGGRRPDEAPPERRQPLEHPVGFHEITGVRLHCPVLERAVVTQAMAEAGVISLATGEKNLIELEFDGNKNGNRADFGPDLPLVFRW
jgi:hypothetical protein